MKRLFVLMIALVGLLSFAVASASEPQSSPSKNSVKPVVAVVQNVLDGIEENTYSLVLKDVVMVFTIKSDTFFDGIPANISMGADGLRKMLKGRKVVVFWENGKKGLFVAKKVVLATSSNIPKNAVIAKPAPIYRFRLKDKAKITPKQSDGNKGSENNKFVLPKLNLPAGSR